MITERDAALNPMRAEALLAEGRFEEARAVLRLAVAKGDTAPGVLLKLAIAEDRVGEGQRARQLMHQVAETCPEWDEPLLRIAESLRASGDSGAEAAYRAALERNPRRVEALLALASLLLLRGASGEAIQSLVRCCGIAPENAEAWDALGQGLSIAGDVPMAHTAFIEAQRHAPTVLDYAMRSVDAAVRLGEAEAELARLDRATADDPLNPVSLVARGMLLERFGARAGAVDALEAAVALAPDAPVPASLLAGLLARSNRPRDAEQVLRRVAELDPDNPKPVNDLATVLMRMHRHAEAHEALQWLIARFGDDPLVLCNLANATVCLGRQDESVEIARRAIMLDAASVLPRRALCNTLPYQESVTAAALLSAARDCSERLPRATLPAFANRPDPERKITIGLLSGSLRMHPVGWLTIAGFETLDPEQFELVCLVQNAALSDPFARRFRTISHEWHEVDTLSDEALARLARERGIDVLIDLGGYGDAGRMPACAHRLAPVQVKWVGMQNHSTGMAEMDWFITDRWETPPELAKHYSERLLYLPDGYVCYSPPPYAPAVTALPALTNGYITFGCFNNLAKVTPRVIAVWAGILQRVPRSRLLLKTHQLSDPATAARIRQAFVAHGVDADRLELQGSSPHRVFLEQYNRIDIVLDPFPYSGGLTTCEALWMGVPTVTLPGEIFASRHSASHMSNAGLPDWVACDVGAYAAMAAAWAQDLPALASLRAGLRARVKTSPLCDAPRFGRALGAALRNVWQMWCEERTLDRLAVPLGE
jgi:predicted O-linked N-acetylglucosamine transferase (SPINDLY family)